MKKWRLILDGPLKGTVNMATDEALLDSYLNCDIPVTLRFYKWEPECISLGYFQDAYKEVDLEKAREMNIDIVRRPTGGRGVLHTDEITYCLIIGENYPGLSKKVTDSYKYLIQGIKQGLEYLGLFPELKAISNISSNKVRKNSGKASSACFDSPSWYELLLEGKKVVGNAQMRRKGAILQHGSIKLTYRPEKIAQVFKVKPTQKKILKKAAQGILDINPNLNEAKCLEAIIKGFENAFQINCQAANYSDYELQRFKELLESKYDLDEWNLKKRKEVFKDGTL